MAVTCGRPSTRMTLRHSRSRRRRREQRHGSDLKTNCHVAIYGVLFDFNKSTLQPASDPVLQQILDLLKKNPTQKIESRDTRTTWAAMPTTRRCRKRAPRLSSPGSHSMGSPATGLQPKALARPGRLQITQPTRAERRIAASRLPTRIVPHIRSRLEQSTSTPRSFTMFSARILSTLGTLAFASLLLAQAPPPTAYTITSACRSDPGP